MPPPISRRLPVGAEPRPAGGVHFRVWAPRRRRVAVVIETDPEAASSGGATEHPLTAEPGGYFAGLVADARPGTSYRYRLDDDRPLPDPASRWQPKGPHGASVVVDPDPIAWTDGDWPGLRLPGQVIYELHLGTFTPEGTFAAAAERLPYLADLGVTAVEVMPVAEFAGRFGWGYDGVDLYAPHHHYGAPDDFRRFVDRAHALGLGVLLDVVYNHLGPDGNYLKAFAPDYFTDRHATDWGESINFDGPNSEPVREFFIANAAYWVREFHVDGLRLDATHAIRDASSEQITAAVARAARAAAGRRAVVVSAENDDRDARLARPVSAGGQGLDALWNDDFHHVARVALTGRRENYYLPYVGAARELVAALRRGFIYQGQRCAFRRRPLGKPTSGLPPWTFINFLENHDQVATSLAGARLGEIADPALVRTLTALVLLGPGTPLLFQGQEFAATSPFVFFADHQPDLARLVRAGRADFLAGFPSLATPAARALLPDPADPATFERCKLDWSEHERHAPALALHRDLLALRRDLHAVAPLPLSERGDQSEGSPPSGGSGDLDAAVLGESALVLRRLGGGETDWLLLVNLGPDLDLTVRSEPLLAPPESPAGSAWRVAWSSEDPRYGGNGAPSAAPDDDCLTLPIPAKSASLLRAEAAH